MKKLLIFFLGILLLTSCKKHAFYDEHHEDPDDPKGGNKKINVCHREGNGGSHIINISINAWPAHEAHGDVRLDDQDADGFVPNNACGFGKMGDCNDSNAAINPGALEICGNSIDENCNGQLNDNCVAAAVICTQTWMAKNLDTRFYRNGDAIPQVTDNNTWATLTTGAWCWYNNDSATYASTYGKLYNWYAVNDSRGLAPAGWHIPSADEWKKLSTCLGGEAIAGNAMKESGVVHWISPNAGATNSSGFTALPAGGRLSTTGGFVYLGINAYWWSSTSFSATDAIIDYVSVNVGNNSMVESSKNSGFSVRCVRN